MNELKQSGSSHIYIAIDLKSFYASVECAEQNLDPLTTNLVVADASRTEKTICLAVSPSLKSYGIPGRARLFEVTSKLREVNRERLSHATALNLVPKDEAGRYHFTASSFRSDELAADASLKVDFITATPRMSLYEKYSTDIYKIYLKYIAPEDIHVYSIDEVFMDVTQYLNTYGMSAHDLARAMIREVLQTTGITATAGIGTNLFLAKVAMDIVAKHVPADADGVRIASLDEASYRRQLWDHTPITDFWRVGKGYAKKLASVGLYTMGDVALCSVGKDTDFHNEDLLYRLFGINAQLLIDHAWGWEPVTMAHIKAFKPSSNSVSTAQVLAEPYPCDKGRLIVREMAEGMALDLVRKKQVTDQVVLHLSYDKDCLENGSYRGEVHVDYYGRTVPKPAHGSQTLGEKTNSSRKIVDALVRLYDQIMDPDLLIRRVSIGANHITSEEKKPAYEQLDLFSFMETVEPDDQLKEQREKEKLAGQREKKMQSAILELQKKFGRNAVLKGMNLEEGATAIQRNGQIGGHKA